MGELHFQNSLTKPSVFLRWMILFLIAAAFLGLLLYAQIIRSFMTNPGLNGLIFGVLFIGIGFIFRQVTRLYPEINWVNHFRIADPSLAQKKQPVLLSPMVKLLGARSGPFSMSTTSMRSILDSVGSRLDEARDTSRYMIGLMVFLGLIGTFWGLLETISSIGKTISALPTGGDNLGGLEDLLNGLKEPLSGMGTAFSSSLFGLAGSMILGFLDLQASHAQNRFYNELEDWLASITELGVAEGTPGGSEPAQIHYMMQELQRSIGMLTQSLQQGHAMARSPVPADANVRELAAGIDGLVKQMRAEQLVVREWMDEQAQQQVDIAQALKVISGQSAPQRR
jgi:hypothetical protein